MNGCHQARSAAQNKQLIRLHDERENGLAEIDAMFGARRQTAYRVVGGN